MAENKFVKMLASRYLPAILASAILLIIIIILYTNILAITDDHFVYALDDAYIHIAISENLIENGNYGPTPYAFETASSSIVWNFLLAGIFLITGVNISVPLILNVILGVLTIFALQKILLSWLPDRTSLLYTLVLIAFIFFIPLPTMIFTGMEHNLQILVSILVVYFVVELLTANDDRSIKFFKYVLAISLPLLFSIRFEAAFFASVIIGLLVLRRYIRYAILLSILSVTPLVLSSMYFLVHDRSIIPNSVWAKSGDSIPLIFRFIVNGLNVPSLLIFYIASLIYFGRYYRHHKCFPSWTKMHVVLLIVSGIGLQHLIVANFGWFYRYEAYLIALMILASIVVIKEQWLSQKHLTVKPSEASIEQNTGVSQTLPNRISRSALVMISIIFMMLLVRAYFAVSEIPYASRDIHASAYNTGRFLDEYYSGKTVILNDIGYPSYYADIYLLDLIGLGSHDWLQLVRDGKANQQTMQTWADEKGAEVALIYSSYIVSSKNRETRIPETWILVGQWKIMHKTFVLADNAWNLYAVNNDYAAEMHQHLVEYTDRLPKHVEFINLYDK